MLLCNKILIEVLSKTYFRAGMLIRFTVEAANNIVLNIHLNGNIMFIFKGTDQKIYSS